MGKLIAALAIALLLSLIGHIWQGRTYLKLRDAVALASADVKQKGEDLSQAQAMASACSDATDDLRELADKRKLEAKGAREQANAVAVEHEKRADAILAKPDPVPGDSCASAQLLVDDWIAERVKP